MSFFGNALGGNPFSTPVGSRIEQATDGTLASENWGLNMEICDLINETEDGPRDAVKAIRKRLAQNAGKNYTVVIYTLTVLETCVKNCGKRFHVLVCNKDFVMELVKLIGPKNDPPMAVQEKVLGLIQAWADAFRNQPEMSGVVTVYQDLLDKGIQFPATDLDAMAPIHTPQRSVDKDIPTKTTSDHADLSHSKTHPHQSHSPPTSIISSMISTNNASSASSSPHHPRPDVTHPPGIGILGGAGEGPQAHEEEEEEVGNLTADQRAKLQSELDVVQANMNVLGEMLSEMKPGYEQPDELELLQELHATCLSMQERLVELISKLSNDELTAELLRINDDLNNLFLRYSRWEKNRDPSTTATGASGPVTANLNTDQKSSSVTSASTILAKAIPQPPSQSLTGTNSSINNNGAKPPLKQNDSLIDFDDDLPEQLSKLSTGTASASAQLSQIQTVTANNAPISSGTGAATVRPTSHGDDDFDMFAQSRNVTYETSKTSGSTYKDNLEPDQMAGGLSSATQAKQNKREQLPPDLEFDEMASWLGQTTGGEESVTSSEFERFLAERAAAAEQLPNVTGSTNTTNINSNVTTTTTTSSSSRTTKEDQKDKKAEGLFAL